MMLITLKKLIVGEKWKRHLAARSRSQIEANKRFAGERRTRRRHAEGHAQPKHFKKWTTLRGGEIFSITQNPEETVAFFDHLMESTSTRNVFVDLEAVRTLTPDAIAVLVAIIHHRVAAGAEVVGNVPADEAAKQLLNDSGFRNYVASKGNPQFRVPRGKIERRQKTGETYQNKFDQRLAQGLIEFATLHLHGKSAPHRPTYSILSEAMLNTWNHAAELDGGREPWWASVYFDDARKRACFTFVDLGVGIFRSHRLTFALNVLTHLRLLNRGELLQRILRGEVRSSTREPGRGNGLPGIYDHCKAGRIRSFVVVSNQAFGDVEGENYRVLSTEFPGTLLYWEIGS